MCLSHEYAAAPLPVCWAGLTNLCSLPEGGKKSPASSRLNGWKWNENEEKWAEWRGEKKNENLFALSTIFLCSQIPSPPPSACYERESNELPLVIRYVVQQWEMSRASRKQKGKFPPRRSSKSITVKLLWTNWNSQWSHHRVLKPISAISLVGVVRTSPSTSLSRFSLVPLCSIVRAKSLNVMSSWWITRQHVRHVNSIKFSNILSETTIAAFDSLEFIHKLKILSKQKLSHHRQGSQDSYNKMMRRNPLTQIFF